MISIFNDINIYQNSRRLINKKYKVRYLKSHILIEYVYSTNKQ